MTNRTIVSISKEKRTNLTVARQVGGYLPRTEGAPALLGQ